MDKKVNFRVVVTPCEGFNGVEKRHADRLLNEIKRHCDVDGAYVAYDTICEFCENDWKNSLDEKGYPICCDKALKEWEENNKPKGA